MIFNTAVSWMEIANIGPHICSALPLTEQRTDFLGGWNVSNFSSWKVKTVCNEFGHYAGFFGPCVASQDNINLTAAQKELLRWHWKLGILMRHIQERMQLQRYEEPSGSSSVMEPMITLHISAASSCAIHVCESSELTRSKQRNHEVTKSRAIPERDDCISSEKYLPGDFVSMDKYVVKTTGRLPGGHGCERNCNKFHDGTIF